MFTFPTTLFTNSAAGGGDPNFSDVVVLSHFNGTNGSTTLTDVKGHTLTANNGAALTTSTSQFGTASLNFDGVNDYAQITATAADEFKFLHDGSDYTFEFFVRLTDDAPEFGSFIIFSNNNFNSSAVGFGINVDDSRRLRVVVTRGSGFTMDFTSSSSVGSLNTWRYIALVKNGSVFTCYINGVAAGTGTYTSPSSSNPANTNPYLGARHSLDVSFFKGQIDELRITKNVARTISGVPVSEFLDN